MTDGGKEGPVGRTWGRTGAAAALVAGLVCTGATVEAGDGTGGGSFGEAVASVTLKTERGVRRWYGDDLEAFSEGIGLPDGPSVIEIDGRAIPDGDLLGDLVVSHPASVEIGGVGIRTLGADKGVVGVTPTDRGGVATLDVVVTPAVPWARGETARLTLFSADAGPLRAGPDPDPVPTVEGSGVCSVSTLGMPVDLVAGTSVLVRFCRPVRIDAVAMVGTVGSFSAPAGMETLSWKEAFVVPHDPGPDGSWIERDALALRTRPEPRSAGTWTTDLSFRLETPPEGTLFLFNVEEQCWARRGPSDTTGRLCDMGDVEASVTLRIESTPLDDVPAGTAPTDAPDR